VTAGKALKLKIDRVVFSRGQVEMKQTKGDWIKLSFIAGCHQQSALGTVLMSSSIIAAV